MSVWKIKRPGKRNPGWATEYLPERSGDYRLNPDAAAKREGEVRRRIEDIQEASRLEDEFNEVWGEVDG